MNLPTMSERAAQAAAQYTFRELHGVVVSAGKMQKTVKVRVGGERWNNFMQKRFLDPKTHLVHDPNGSLRTGDVVAITPGWRTSKKVRHVVKYIIAPAFVPADERPPVPTVEERFADRIARKDAKDERKRARDDLERMERVVARGSKLAHLAEWELARMHRILAARDPARRTTAQMERIDVRSKEILRRGSKIVSQAEWAIGNSVLSRETV